MSKIYTVCLSKDKSKINVLSEQEYQQNDEVILQLEEYLEYAKVLDEIKTECDTFGSIIRKATKKDVDIHYKNLKDELEAKKKCEELIGKLDLNMHILSAKFTFDRLQLLISFSSDERVDFRELAKKLASIYKTRIELRQIGARDKARCVGGIGVCGQKLCCSKFLKEINSISISKAKNQNLALNPSKINGACGRLLCCLCYEDEQYKEASKGLLSVGKKVIYNGQEATIKSVDILTRTYKIMIDEEKIEVKADEVKNVSKK